MTEQPRYTPEEVSQKSDERYKTYMDLRSEGATEEVYRDRDGSPLPPIFTPTAEQVERARQEMIVEQAEKSRLETYMRMREEGATEEIYRDKDGNPLPSVFTPTAEQVEGIIEEMEKDRASREVEPAEDAIPLGSEVSPENENRVAEGNIEASREPTIEELNLQFKNRLDALDRQLARIIELLSEGAPNTAEGAERGGVENPENNTEAITTPDQDENNRAPNTTTETERVNTENPENNTEATTTPEQREAEEGEASTPLTEAMNSYLMLLAANRRWILGRPSKEQLAEARANYEREVTREVLLSAERAVSEEFPNLAGEEKIRKINDIAAAKMVSHHVDRTMAEAELQNDAFPKKAINWLKRHPGLRLVAGAALTGGMVLGIATGNVPLATATLIGKSALAGIGAGIATEAGLGTVQRMSNQYLRELTSEQIAEMSPEELRRVASGIGAYEVRRGGSFENSEYKDTVLAVLEKQKQDLIEKISSYEGQAGDRNTATERFLAQHLSSMNIEREGKDLDEREKSITRSVAAGIAGTAVMIAAAAIGGRSIPTEGIPTVEPLAPGESVGAPISSASEAGVLPVAENVSSAPTGEIITYAESGDSIWKIAENNLQTLADRQGYNLTPDQMEAATDRAKDWYIANGFGSGPDNWLSIGDRVPFNLAQGEEWLKYGIENPKL